MSSPVFISYASIDQKVAETICYALESRGYTCWIAFRDVGPGENFQEAIVRAIRSAKVMLLVFTSNANNSNEIKKELVLAGRHHVTVVPVRVEDVAPNDALAYECATRQWIDLFKDWEREIQRLAAQIGSILTAAGAGVATPTGPIPPAQTARKSPYRPLLSVLALVVSIGGAYLFRQYLASLTDGAALQPSESAPAGTFDGTWHGELSCAKLSFTKGPLMVPIDITVAGAAISFAHKVLNQDGSAVVGTEVGIGDITGNGVVKLSGTWNSNDQNPRFTYTSIYNGTLSGNGGSLQGTQIWSFDGKTENRSCSIAIRH